LSQPHCTDQGKIGRGRAKQCPEYIALQAECIENVRICTVNYSRSI